MQLHRVSLAPMELVSLPDLKAHMRIDHEGEDTILSSLQRAAYDWIEQFTNRSLLTTAWRFISSPLKGGSEIQLSLPFPNLLEVESVHHLISNTNKQAITRYTVQQHNGIPYLCLLSKGKPIEVTYKAGFGPHPNFVPEAFHHVIKVLVAFWYQNREGLSCGVPDTVEIFLRPYQIRRLI